MGRVVDQIIVRTNLLLFWFKTRATLTDTHLEVTIPNSLLLVPAGQRRVVQPLDRVSNVEGNVRYHVIRMIIGLALLGLAGSYYERGLDGYPSLAIAGMLFLAYSVTARLIVADASGTKQQIPVSILHRRQVERFAQVVMGSVVATRSGASRHVPPAVVPTDRLKQLSELHRLYEAGALTRDEYESEKQRVLRSLD